MSVPILITTCDPYLPALRVTLALIEKYWPVNPIVIVGFKAPDYHLPERATFHSLGDFKDYPIDRYSDQLRDAMQFIEGDTFVFMLDDYWPIRQVDVAGVEYCNEVASYTPNVLRVDLTADRLGSFYPSHPRDLPVYGRCGHIDLLQDDPQRDYHMSLMPAVWRKDNWLKVLKTGWSPWKVELEGTPHVRDNYPDLIVLGTFQCPVLITLGRRSGNANEVVTDGINGGLPLADRDWLKKEGLL